MFYVIAKMSVQHRGTPTTLNLRVELKTHRHVQRVLRAHCNETVVKYHHFFSCSQFSFVAFLIECLHGALKHILQI